jgi:hypothetical protein
MIAAGDSFTPPRDWLQRQLPAGWVLHHERTLDLAEHAEPDGRRVLLLGNAYCLRSIESGGSGRYAIMDWPYLSGDRAGALLSLFYGERDGAFVVSSNAGLVAAALGGAQGPSCDYELKHRTQQNYVPAPGSRYRGVRRLFRDQRVNLAARSVERSPAPVAPLGSREAAVSTLCDELTQFACDLRERTRGRIYLQLTAGLDSRTLASAFNAAGIDYETVTFRGPAKPESDIVMAARLSRVLGVRHHVIVPEPHDPVAAEAYGRITSDALNDWDLTHVYPGNVYRFVGRDDVMVGGGCLELGRQKFAQLFGDLTLESATGRVIWRRLARDDGPPDFVRFLDDWLGWRRADPYPLNLVATHYLDQRIGAWAATAMQGYDLVDGRVIHPANNPRIFAALVTPPLEEQVAGTLQFEAISAMAPALTAFPVNPVSVRTRLRHAVGRTRRLARAVLGSSGF